MSIEDIKNRTMPTGKTSGMFEYLQSVEKGLNGDLVLVATPATLGSSAAVVAAAIAGAAAKFTREITIELQSADGELHDWFNGTFAILKAEVTVGTGTAAIAGALTVATFVNGRAKVTLEYIGTWAAADTATLTITGSTKLGYDITNKTSVDTLVA